MYTHKLFNYVENLKKRYIVAKNAKNSTGNKKYLCEFYNKILNIFFILITIVLAVLVIFMKLINSNNYWSEILLDAWIFNFQLYALLITILLNTLLKYEKKYDMEHKIIKLLKSSANLYNLGMEMKNFIRMLDMIDSIKLSIKSKIIMTMTIITTLISDLLIIVLIMIFSPDIFDYLMRIYIFLVFFIIATIFITTLLKSGKWSFVYSILAIIFIYLLLIMLGSLIFGSYYNISVFKILESKKYNDIEFNHWINSTFKVGAYAFFNYSDTKGTGEVILRFFQYIFGKIIEWMFLGFFSTIFITKMMPKIKE